MNLETLDMWLWLTIVGVFAICVGSFLGLVSYRLPIMLHRRWGETDIEDPAADIGLIRPGSHCESCQQPLKWYHNVPLLSFVWLRGQCAYCKHPIPRSYFLIEVTTLTAWLLLAWRYGADLQFLTSILAASALVSLAYIDAKHKILPDEITLSLLLAGLAINSFNIFVSLQDAIYGAIAGYLVFFLLYKVFFLLTQREGLGRGDFKLLAAIGAWLGWQALPGVLLLASSAGLIVALLLVAAKRYKHGQEIPFGPYLAGACFCGLLLPEFVRSPFSLISSIGFIS